MKNPVRLHLWLPCLLLLSLSACDVRIDTNEKIGSGKAATQTRPAAAFTAIEFEGPFALTVDGQGQGPQVVEVSGDDNLLDTVETTVRGDTLVLRTTPTPGIHLGVQKYVRPLVVHVANGNLKRIRLSGSGNLELNQYHGERLELDSVGAGDMHIAGRATELLVHSNGSGDIDVHQMLSQRVNAKIESSGDFVAAGINGELTLAASGSGDIHASEVRLDKLDVVLNGSGDIVVEGSSRQLRAELAGSGDFNACSLKTEALTAIMNGPGDACFTGPLRRFDAEVHGSGNLSANGLQAESVRAVVTGAGDLTLAGSAATMRAELSGSGDLEARDLQIGSVVVKRGGPGTTTLGPIAGTLDIDSSASGDLQAQLTGKSINISNRGAGAITISGTADIVTAFLSGSGEVDASRLITRRADVKVKGPGNAVVNLRASQNASSSSRLVMVDRDGAHPQGTSTK